MSPSYPENDRVHRGLQDLGRRIDAAAAEPARARPTSGNPGTPLDATPTPAKRKRSRKRVAAWTAGTVFVVVALLAGAAAGYGWYLNHQIHRIDLHNLSSAPAKGADANTENILMIGSTSRCALKVQNPAYGLCSQGVTGVNSDVVMILHLNPANNSLSILSIPRDLFVPNARTTGANKIDAALYQGPDQLINAIEEDFGIPIQHFVELNFDSFISVVNDLGGIKMYFPEPVFDAYSGLNIQTTGCINLSGTQALQVVRARELQYKAPGVTSTDPSQWPKEAQSDLARIRRDHEFLRVLAAGVKAKGLGNPISDQQMVSDVVGQLTVDSGLSATDMINLVLNYHNVDVNSAPQLTLPVAQGQFGSYDYKGGSYGDVEFPSGAQDHVAIDQFLGLPAGEDTYSGGALPAPSSVTVSVLNGSGTYNQATNTAAGLSALGFHVGTVGDTTPVGQQAETVVYYSSKTPAQLAAAQAVANSMSGAVIMAKDPSQVQPGSQVTVVTGTDFSVNSPSPSASSATPPTSTTTTTPSSHGDFAPPSKTVSPLQPWDPRSCTASGGEGP